MTKNHLIRHQAPTLNQALADKAPIKKHRFVKGVELKRDGEKGKNNRYKAVS